MRIHSLARALFLNLAVLFFASAAFAQTDITTWQVDTKHTGVNAKETVLTPSFVSTPNNFVPLFSEQVDGQVFAQPLYLSAATSGLLPGGWADGQTHKNVVFVVTENATLYAFDADQDPKYAKGTGSSHPIWEFHLVPAGNKTAVPIPKIDTNAANDIFPLFGDTATPVIDSKNGIIYVVSALKDTGTLPASHPYEQLLWAINVKSGQPVNGSPAVINPVFNGQFPGNHSTVCTPAIQVPNTPNATGCENDNEPAPALGTIPFYPLHSHLRSALTLDNFNGHNTLYLAYASHSDGQPYSGFLVGYNATTLQQTNEFTTTPDNTFEAGIWMGGASPAIDPALNKMYVITGNGGNWDNKDSSNKPLPPMGVDSQGNVFSKATNWPMSVLAFDTTPAGTVPYRGQNELQVPFADANVWFTPAQWDSFNDGDQDLGSGGPLLFDTLAPDGSTKQLMIGGGKAGVMFVLDRTNLGGIDSQGSGLSSGLGDGFVNSNAVQEIIFPSGTGFFSTPVFFNNHIYFSGGSSGARSRAVGFNETTNTYISSTEDASPEGAVDKNAGIFISANGTSNGLVWQSNNGIRAWDASNLKAGAIYNSVNIDTDDSTEAPCVTPTFSLPIVSGGKAYFTCYQAPTSTGTAPGVAGTFTQPSDNKPGYLWIYGSAPVAAGAPTQVPLNVSAQAGSDSEITVTWTDPDSGSSTAHTGFNVLRATCANCTPVLIQRTSNTSFVDIGLNDTALTSPPPSALSANTTYFYTVVATNDAGSSNASNIASATTFAQYSQSGLVAYWPMDEGVLQAENATSSTDFTGNGHTAVKVPPPAGANGINEIESSSSGYIGGSWNFHGTTVIDRLVASNEPDLQFTAKQSYSLVAWVNPTTLQGFSGPDSTQGLDGASIIVKSRDQGNEYGLWINLNGRWEARSGTPGAAGTVITGTPAKAGAWTQLALVQDGPNNKRYLYVNGQLAGQGTAQDASGGGDLWFGQQNLFPNGQNDQTSTDGFQGSIDEVRIYNSAITPTQLLNDFSDPVYQASSIQTHAGAPVSISLFPFGLSGLPTTESRVAPNHAYTIQLNFAQQLSTTPAAVLNAQPGSTQQVQGSVSAVKLDPSGMIVTVTLANVANNQALQLHLTGLTSEASSNTTYDLPFNVLEGDVTGDHVVDTADANAITNLIAANNNNPITTITSANAQFDLNLDGIVNSADAMLATSLNGLSLPVQADASLAAFKLTSASTSNGGNIASGAVDNNLISRWESVQGPAADPSSLIIDLNNTANIHSILLDWENAAGANYVLQTSNDPSVFPEAAIPDCSAANTKWTTIQTVTGNTSGGLKTYNGLTANGRFVRMCGTTRTTTFGYSILDFEVLGSFGPTTPTAPVITSATSATATVGQPFSYTIASSPAAASFNATGLPAGLSLNGAVISGTPTATGSFSVVLSATNSTGQTGMATLNLTINAVAPVITSATTATATVGQAFSYTITSNPTAASFNATGLPAGLSFNGAVISGTPTATGSFNVMLSATNSTGQIGTATLKLTVNGAAPVITSATTATATVGQAFSYTITSNPTAASFNATGLPAGLSFNGAVISGIPTTTGTFSVTLSATNSTGQAGAATLKLTVNAAAPVITSATTAVATVGQPFSYTITSNPAAASFGATGLPAGLSLKGAVISGTPTAIGMFSITLSAANSTGQTGMATLNLTISNVVPVLPVAPGNLTLTAISSSQINLSWTASTTSGVTYSVFRSTTSGFTPSQANLVAGASNLTATTFSDSGLTANTQYFYIVEAVNGSGGETPSAQASITTPVTSSTSPVAEVIAIDAGDLNNTPPVTAPFVLDTDFTGSTGTDTNTQTIKVTAPGAAAQQIYQTAHQGVVTYTIPSSLLTPGQPYTVVLHFAELYFSQPNQRQFNVSINGVPVLQNFDIVAEAGNANLTAVVETFPNVTPVNGQIVIAFTSGAFDQPMMNGIEIRSGGNPVPSAPTALTATTVSTGQINLNWTASISSGVTYNVYRSTTPGFIPSAATTPLANVQGTSFSDTLQLTPATEFYYVVEAVTSTGVLSPQSQHTQAMTLSVSNDVIAINAGGSMAVNQFLPDTDFVGGGTDNPNQAITIPAALATTGLAAPQQVYQDARQGTVTYTIPASLLTPGKNYTVVLHFAELYFTGAGDRQFNISINGVMVQQNFDIFAAAGNASFTAVVKTFPNITPVNGQIVIAFTNGAHDQPMVNGIEIQ